MDRKDVKALRAKLEQPPEEQIAESLRRIKRVETQLARELGIADTRVSVELSERLLDVNGISGKVQATFSVDEIACWRQ